MIEFLQASGVDSLPAVAGEVVGKVVEKTTEMSLWQLFKGGGWLMWVFALRQKAIASLTRPSTT